MILPEGRFAENNTLPEGIVYQIRIFTLSRKASVSDLNGLSPVFERTTTTGKHAYSVGLFKSYKDALSNLNKVKKRGFRDAQIDAFQNGQIIGVSKARDLESKVRTLMMVRIYPENGQSLSEEAIAAIHEHSDKDLIKSVEAGAVVFTAGPFAGGCPCRRPESRRCREHLRHRVRLGIDSLKKKRDQDEESRESSCG